MSPRAASGTPAVRPQGARRGRARVSSELASWLRSLSALAPWESALVSVSRLDLVRSQFDMAWSLVDFHLERLTARDHLWEPAAHCWTVHPGADGT